jgi:hypothetical protein
MKVIFISWSILSSFLIQPALADSVTVPPSITGKIVTYANEYNVNPVEMWDIMSCESNGSTTVESTHIMKSGIQERSFGLYQIYLPAHPNITLGEAEDPDYSIPWAAEQMSDGNAPRVWYVCYKRYEKAQGMI